MEPLNEFCSWNLRHSGADDGRPMTEEELNELFERMQNYGLPDGGLSMGQADGYLTALIVGPEPVPVHQWMQLIFAQPTLAEHGSVQARRLLLRARCLDIQLRLSTPSGQITSDDLFTPLHAEVEPGSCITPYRLDADVLRIPTGGGKTVLAAVQKRQVGERWARASAGRTAFDRLTCDGLARQRDAALA